MTQQKAGRVTKPTQNHGNIAEVAATRVTDFVGSGKGLILAVAVVVIWAASGPLFGFSNTWQLVINTGTTIVTFLMVFLIQSTQNRDTEAVQVKLDEIIRAIGNAQNELLDLEELDEKELDRIRDTYRAMARDARGRARPGRAESEP